MARLVFNGGSSSWKCGVYDVAPDARAGEAAASLAELRLSWPAAGEAATLETTAANGTRSSRQVAVPRDGAVPAMLEALERAGVALGEMAAVGHRIVHGAHLFRATTWLDDAALASLETLAPFAPSHNPIELAAVAAVRERLPLVRQYAVFDTQFHRTLPPAAYVYAGPAAWLERNIRRYGFHGSSVAYASERVAEMLGRPIDASRLVVAHLGGGCSVTAVRDGASVETSMGFTPLEGTMMGTRSGSIDPAIAVYLMREAAKTGAETLESFAESLDRTLNRESGLAAVSGISGDVREIEAAARAGDPRAAFALELFVHRLATTIAGMLPSLERLDALVFTGGIGEHAAGVRARTAARLRFAGIALDEAANADTPRDADISAASATSRTLVVTAREEWYVAREGSRLPA